MGRIRAMGYKVTRERLRQAIRQIDPMYTALRWRGGLITRRPYAVAGPNSLWHIDSHHKLVRWKFVTHAAIDGYTRMIVYVGCSNNNRASTVYNLFLSAVRNYGLPSRVHSDQGRENVFVARHMLENRGLGRRSMIVASSVHNQHIERLWRDLHRCATKIYYRLFYYLEDIGLLQPTIPEHIYSLHYVYLPRINRSIKEFSEGWNHHGVRTEGNKTPNQLFTEGLLQLRYSGHTALDFFDDVDDLYGFEEEGISTNDDEEGANFEPCNFMLSFEHYQQLTQLVNPLQESENYGIELYEETVDFVTTIIRQNSAEYF
jgi:hypothetical protein